MTETENTTEENTSNRQTSDPGHWNGSAVIEHHVSISRDESAVQGSTSTKSSFWRFRLPNYSTQQWTALSVVCYLNFLIAACVSLQAPFFPKEAEKKGATPTQYGFVFGVFELIVLLMSPILGKIVHIVSPVFQLKAGSFIMGVSSILFGITDRAPYGAPFLQLAFLVRSVEAVGAAAIFTMGYIIAVREFPDQCAAIFSVIEACFGMGLIVGPSVGGVLYQVGGYILPFVVMGGMLLTGSITAVLFMKDTGDDVPKKSGDFLKFLMNIGVILDFLGTTTALALIGFNSATLEPHLRQFDLSPAIIGVIFMISGTTYAVTSPLWGKVCTMGFRHKNISIFGCILICVGLVFIGPLPGIPLSPQTWIVVTSLIACSLGMSAKIVTSFVGTQKDTVHSRGFPDDVTTSGMVSSVFVASTSLGAFIGPSLGGWLLERIGYRNGTAVMLGIDLTLMVSLMLYVSWQKIRERNRPSKGSENEKTRLLNTSH